MNHIYRVVYNKETGTFQAVAETAKSHSTSKNKTIRTAKGLAGFLLTPISLAIGLVASTVAHAAPTDGQVTAGAATINQNGLITNINQSSQNAAINWQSFNIAHNETVNFNQPNAGSVTLNRVIGNERSVIDGAMNANGKVFISNANGMLIGKDAKINVGSLVATTANISDDDVMNGRYQFTGGQGSIENLGQISVPKGGVVALVAPIVKNGGTITAPQGNVLLASAENFSITLPDNANFAYTLDKGTLQGLVDNGGAILADGGRVVLTAQGVDTVKKSLIKHTGAIQANTVSNNNGVIELLGDLDNSALTVSGSLKAEAKDSGDGGFIETSASQVKIEDSAEVSTLAENGKTGTWLIDPNDIIIANGAGIKPDGTPYTKDEVTANGLTIANQLTKSNVTIQSTKGKSEGKGDVIIDDEIVGGNPHTNPVHTLTLNAHNDIHINKNIDLKGAVKLALEYGQGSADGGKSDYHIQRGVKVNLPMGNTLTTKKGKDGEKIEFTVIHQMPDIIKNKDGDWESQFNIRNIAFGKDIDLSYTKDYEGFAGWKLQSGHPYNISDTETRWARIAGLGHTINNLTLHSKKNSTKTGLFQDNVVGTQDEYIRDIGLINVNVKSEGNHSEAGGLFGHGGNIHNSYVIGDITTTGNDSFAGGLMGRGIGIYNSYSQGNVTTHGQNSQVGGLVGWGWNINSSYSTSSVSSTGNYSNAGGLMGYGAGISNSYATGKVLTEGQDANAGGLVGYGHDINNSYSNNISILAKNNGSIAGGLVGVYHGQDPSKNSFFNKDKQPKLSAVGKIDTTYNPNSITNFTNLVGKTDSELKQKSTFTDWDFDTVWRIQEGEDYPRLRALTEGKIVINPTTPVNPTDLTIKAHNLSKVYDGKAVNDEGDLDSIALKNGYQGIVDVIGTKGSLSTDELLKLNQELEGELRLDGEGSNWKGAVNVGTYTLVPTGLSGGQKYEIVFEKGTLTIDKALLIIQAMNNIKPAGKSNPPVENIGVFAKGLVKGDTISDVKIKYIDSDEKGNIFDKKGDIIQIVPSDAILSNGSLDNYDVQYKNGKLLIMHSDYDLNDKFDVNASLSTLHEKEILAYRDALNAVENEMQLAQAVYGHDDAKKGDAKSFYEVVRNTKTNQLKNVGRGEKLEENEDKLFELVFVEDHSGTITEKLFDGFAAALYKNTKSNEYYVVFRGSGTFGDPNHLGDWINNYKQATNIQPVQKSEQYVFAEAFAHKAMEHVTKNGGKVTFVGHSLGGGLATYAAAKSKYDVPVVTFNPAVLGGGSRYEIAIFNIVNNKYGKNVPPYHHHVFDNDMLDKVFNLGQDNMGTKHEFNLLSTKSMIGDHRMDHVLITKSLSNIMSENIENTNLKDKNGNMCIGCLQYVRQNKYFNIKDTLPNTNKSIDRSQWLSYDRERTIGNIQGFNREILDEWRNNHYKFKKPEMLGKDGVELFNKELLMTATHVILGSIELYDGTTNKYIPFNQNSPFYLKNGDKIRSGKYKSRIRFPDDSIIELEPNSEVQINVVPNQLWADTIIVLKGKLPKKTAQGRLYWK